MDFIIIAAVAFVCGFMLGEFVQAQRFILKVSKDPDTMIAMLTRLKEELARLKNLEDNKLPLDSIEVKLERQGNMIYCFKAENDEFLGQGTDQDELLKTVSKKLGNANLLAKKVTEVNQTA